MSLLIIFSAQNYLFQNFKTHILLLYAVIHVGETIYFIVVASALLLAQDWDMLKPVVAKDTSINNKGRGGGVQEFRGSKLCQLSSE